MYHPARNRALRCSVVTDFSHQCSSSFIPGFIKLSCRRSSRANHVDITDTHQGQHLACRLEFECRCAYRISSDQHDSSRMYEI